MSCAWFDSLITLLQICTGLTIMVVESVIIEEESEGTPPVYSVLHREVALRGKYHYIMLSKSTRLFQTSESHVSMFIVQNLLS